MADLIQRQGREVMAKVATFADTDVGIDPSAILFDEEKWEIIYADELGEVLMPMLVDGWRAGIDRVRAGSGKTAKAVKAPIEGWDVFNAEVLSWAQRYPRHFAERVNVAFARRITEVVAQGMAAGENMRELRQRLRKKVFNGDVTSYRAEMIAHTKGSRAAHAGEEQAWIQSGVVEAKVWRALEGACEFCQAMDGKMIELGGAYHEIGQSMEGVDGGKMALNYETVEGPPLHPHCHCGKEPVFKELGQNE